MRRITWQRSCSGAGLDARRSANLPARQFRAVRSARGALPWSPWLRQHIAHVPTVVLAECVDTLSRQRCRDRGLFHFIGDCLAERLCFSEGAFDSLVVSVLRAFACVGMHHRALLGALFRNVIYQEPLECRGPLESSLRGLRIEDLVRVVVACSQLQGGTDITGVMEMARVAAEELVARLEHQRAASARRSERPTLPLASLLKVVHACSQVGYAPPASSGFWALLWAPSCRTASSLGPLLSARDRVLLFAAACRWQLWEAAQSLLAVGSPDPRADTGAPSLAGLAMDVPASRWRSAPEESLGLNAGAMDLAVLLGGLALLLGLRRGVCGDLLALGVAALQRSLLEQEGDGLGEASHQRQILTFAFVIALASPGLELQGVAGFPLRTSFALQRLLDKFLAQEGSGDSEQRHWRQLGGRSLLQRDVLESLVRATPLASGVLEPPHRKPIGQTSETSRRQATAPGQAGPSQIHIVSASRSSYAGAHAVVESPCAVYSLDIVLPSQCGGGA